MKFCIADIKIADRKRPLGDIVPLTESIKELGLLNPITIQKDGTLIAGYHRLSACKSLEWSDIDVTVVELDQLHAELAEIDDKLRRSELTDLQRSLHLARRKEIYLALYPETKEGNSQVVGMHKKIGNGMTGIKLNVVAESATTLPYNALNTSNSQKESFTSNASKNTGIAERTIREDVQIGEQLKHHATALHATPIADRKTDLLRLARKTEIERVPLIDKIVNGEAKTVKEAELQIAKETQAAQVQLVPIKPKVTIASWDKWLPLQDPVDLLITDPPYSTDVDDIESFANMWLPLALSKVKPTGRAYVCIGAYPHELKAYLNVQGCIPVSQVLVWTYRNTMGPSPKYDYKLNWQAILYFKGVDASPLECPLMNEQFSVQDLNAPDGRFGYRYHAWQKPEELAERLIRHSTKFGDTVMDCFTGTGTFLLTANKLGRIAYGCEVSEDMAKIATIRGCEVLSA